jgi:AcrR family transcriptional regulator
MAKPPPTPKSVRVSRDQAIAKYLEGTIKLLDTRTVSDITVQEIATAVGLNHGYVFRYFGTRLDLLVAVTDELADRALLAVRTEMERRVAENVVSPPGDLSLIALGRPFTMKRTFLVQYLVSCGVPAERFGPKAREMIQTSIDTLLQQGVSLRMAQAQAIKVSVMLWAQVSLAAQMGVSNEEAADLFFLTVDELNHSQDSDKRLGWI